MRYRQYYRFSMQLNRKLSVPPLLNLWLNARRILGLPVQAHRVEE